MYFTQRLLLLTFISFLFSLSGCALLPKGSPQTGSGSPGQNVKISSDSVVLFATSNLGDDLSAELGLPILSADFQSLRNEYGSRVLWLDGGHFGDNLTIYDRLGITATLSPLKIKTVQAGKVKVGMMSIQSGEEDLEKLEAFILSQAEELKKEGSDIIVLLTDLPISCRDSRIAPRSSAVRKPNEPQGFCQGALASILERLPEGTVHAAIVSGARRDLHHFIYPRWSSHETAGIPVVSGGLRGGFVNIVSLTPGDPDRTRIEGSIQVHGQTKIHGNPISPDPVIQTLLAPLREQRAGEKKEILASFTDKLSITPGAESSLTDFIADVIKDQTHADIVISPLGVVAHAPSPWIEAGDFSRADLNALFPLPVPIVTIEVKGEELKTMLELSEAGLRGFSSVSGVKLRLLNPEEEAPKLANGIRNRLLSTDEPEIEAKETYHLAVPLALVQGADDWRAYTQDKNLARRIKVATSSEQAQDLKQIVASWLSHQKAGSKITLPATRLTFVKAKQASLKGAKRGTRGKRHNRAHGSKAKRRSQPSKT